MPRSRPTRIATTAVVAAAIAVATSGCSPVADPDAAADAFVAAALAPGRSTHLRSEAEAILPLVGDAGFTSEFDLVGPEFYGTSTMHAMGEEVEVRLASIAGVSFSAFFGAETLGAESRLVTAPDPFAGLTRGDVEVVGTDRKEGHDVVHLRIGSDSAAVGAIATLGHLGLGNVLVDASAFDLFVTADGTPILAEIDVTASATGELSGTLEAGIRIVFSRWGELAELPVPFEIDRFPVGTTFVADNRYDEGLVWRDGAGHELAVEACSRGTSADFDGTAFTVEFASDGVAIMSTEPANEPIRYSSVGARSSISGWELPILRQASPEPCTGRDGS
jgi:hypothetical protein